MLAIILPIIAIAVCIFLGIGYLITQSHRNTTRRRTSPQRRTSPARRTSPEQKLYLKGWSSKFPAYWRKGMTPEEYEEYMEQILQ